MKSRRLCHSENPGYNRRAASAHSGPEPSRRRGTRLLPRASTFLSKKGTDMSTPNPRKADATVDPLFISRWSTRAYTGEEIPESVLLSVLEAARWAASARNAQPWRFVIARRNGETFDRLVPTMSSVNQKWAPKVSALIALLSAKAYPAGDGTEPNPYHTFDAGAAWANLSLQANMLGWRTRAIGAFDRGRAAVVMKVPDSHAIEILVAIGRAGSPDALPEDLRKLNAPNTRTPLRDLISEEAFRS
jgi:nitroreductase